MASLPPGSSALGARVPVVRNESGRRSVAEVVGVVEDSYGRVPGGRARPRCYLPLDPSWACDYFSMFVRAPWAAALVPGVRQILSDID